ncbi:MAG: capsule-associated protein CAP1, partial [Piccolia ochrophora]
MRSWLSLGAQHEPSTTALSSVLLVCSFLTTHAAIPKHSLATWAASWLLAWLFSQVRKAGLEPSFVDGTRRKRLCWAAGLLIVLKQICERVVGDYDELRWTKAFLPPAIILLRSSGLMSSTSVEHSSTDPLSRGSKQLIIIATATACLALGPLSTSPPTITLGLCSILLTCLASYAIEEALRIASDEKSASNGGFVSADGSLSRIRPMSNSSNIILVSLSDVSCVATVGCTIAAIIFEPVQHDGLVFERQWDKLTGDHWRTQQVALDVVHGATITVAGTIRAFLMLSLIQRRGALSVGFIDLGAGLCSSLVSSLTIIRVYWTLLSATSLALLSGESGSSEYVAGVSRRRMRLKQLLTLLSVLSFGVLTVLLLRNRHDFAPTLPESPSDSAPTATPPQPSRASDLKQHPIYQLINKAEKDFETTKSKQSKTLGEAVAEYRRRYQLPPPPHFDKWYEFAKKRDVRLIDEYDTIFHSLQPFWGIDPATIRARTREALGFRNALMGVAIRRGQVTLVEGGVEWLQKATVGMVQEFVGHLPDMDLAFNTHDEPRVVVPHDDLKRLLDIAKTETMAAAFANAAPKDSFSNRPRYLTNGENFREFKTTRFNRYAHQPTWVPSRLSCSPDTPARSLHENPPDNTTSWALDDLSLIHNATAFSDICLSPSLHETFGFFDRPNAFDVVHELFPVFSQSKVSSFQDILYPSPWYWYDKVKYDEAKDVDWEKKESKLYWRGSTTGGFSRDGGWRRQHRQN